MPLVSEFFGIKIYMYWNEHFPPHFHVEYNEFKAVISISDAVVLNGFLPSKQLKFVLAWCELHKAELEINWKSAINNNMIQKIEPLM